MQVIILSENNSQGLCASCGNQIEGQEYYIHNLIICQRCKLKIIDGEIQSCQALIPYYQTKIKDLKKRKEKVEHNEAEFYTSKL